MMHAEARKLLETTADIARTTDIPAMAETCLERMIGMINYAVLCGHLTPEQHAAEYVLIKLLREERRQAVAA